MVGFNVNAQEETGKLVTNIDYIVGDYAFSFKDKKIGSFSYYDCSEDGMYAECYGYLEIPKIEYHKTKLYIIGKKVLLLESEAFDTKTLSVIDAGISWKEAYKQDAMYVDKDGVYRRLYKQGKVDDSGGFKHLAGRFLVKNKELYYADDYKIEKINNSHKLDFESIKPIAGNFFMDKNAYYFANTYEISEEEGYSIDFIKIQDKQKTQEIYVTNDYCIINTKVYPLRTQFKEIKIDYKNIKRIDIKQYDGKMALSDKNNIFYRYMSTYPLEQIDCNDDNKKDKLYCIEKDFSKIKLLRRTYYSEYHYDIDNGIIYLDHAGDPMDFTETSGDLYKTSTGFYLNNPDYYATVINEVKIWNPKKKAYENLDMAQYHYVHDTVYFYKGNLYGHASKLLQRNFNIEALKVLQTYNSYYIADDKRIIDFEQSKDINLEKLSVLKMPDGEPTKYLTDGKSLIYEKQLIKNFENNEVHVINEELIITKNYIYSKGNTITRKELAIPIVFLPTN